MCEEGQRVFNSSKDASSIFITQEEGGGAAVHRRHQGEWGLFLRSHSEGFQEEQEGRQGFVGQLGRGEDLHLCYS